jgi:hypothetical protein
MALRRRKQAPDAAAGFAGRAARQNSVWRNVTAHFKEVQPHTSGFFCKNSLTIASNLRKKRKNGMQIRSAMSGGRAVINRRTGQTCGQCSYKTRNALMSQQIHRVPGFASGSVVL